MVGKNVGYTRCSTQEQNLDRQLDGVDLDRVFEEKASGKDTHRPILQECLSYLREFDVLHVHSIDRLCRNLGDLLRIVTELREKNVCVRFHKENLSFGCGESDAISELMLHMLGAVAQFERSLIKSRQAEGIAKAKQNNVKFGRKLSFTKLQVEEIMKRVSDGEKIAAIANDFACARGTIYNLLKREKEI